MSNATDDLLRDILMCGLDAEFEGLPDPSVVWWRAYRDERESRMTRAVLPMSVLAAPFEAAASIAPALLLGIGAFNGYFSPSAGWLAAFVSAVLLCGSWVAAQFFQSQSDWLLTAPGSRSY